MMEDFTCKIANVQEIEEKWEYEIRIHKSKKRWKQMRDNAVKNFVDGKSIVYIGILNGEIITEATALIDKSIIQNSEGLLGCGRIYLSNFKTNKMYEGKGYFSKLFKFIEYDLRRRGFSYLTLGVEREDTRCKKIYAHLGFTEYLKTGEETYLPFKKGSEPQTMIVDYYMKDIRKKPR